MTALALLAAAWALFWGARRPMGNAGINSLSKSAVNIARCRYRRRPHGQTWEKVPW